jgi:hypothetical protein
MKATAVALHHLDEDPEKNFKKRIRIHKEVKSWIQIPTTLLVPGKCQTAFFPFKYFFYIFLAG